MERMKTYQILGVKPECSRNTPNSTAPTQTDVSEKSHEDTARVPNSIHNNPERSRTDMHNSTVRPKDIGVVEPWLQARGLAVRVQRLSPLEIEVHHLPDGIPALLRCALPRVPRVQRQAVSPRSTLHDVDGFQFYRRLYSLYQRQHSDKDSDRYWISLSSLCCCVSAYRHAARVPSRSSQRYSVSSPHCLRHVLPSAAQRQAWPHLSWQHVSRASRPSAIRPFDLTRQTSDKHSTILLSPHGLKRPSRYQSYHLRWIGTQHDAIDRSPEERACGPASANPPLPSSRL